MIYHAWNHARDARVLFHDSQEYEAFEGWMIRARRRRPLGVLAYCLMPDHWHMVLWLRGEGQLGGFLRAVTIAHSKWWRSRHGRPGDAPLYKDRFRSFPLQMDESVLTICRYVESNPVRAGLTDLAEDWLASSRWRRVRHNAEDRDLLAPMPVGVPPAWGRRVNEPLAPEELSAIRVCLRRGRPFGGRTWQARAAAKLGLEHTLRPRGRPRKNVKMT